MTEPLQMAVRAVLIFLADVTHECAPPDAAMHRLQQVAAAHPEVRMQLLWNTESYDKSIHYDVLLNQDQNSTISVSLSPDRALPWPLRGVQRWTEANLVQVNGRTLTVESAVKLLDVLWNEAPLMERMINTCLIKEELARNPITIDDDELQNGMDALRRGHELYTAEDTERWLHQRGMTQVTLERMVSEHLTGELLCKRIVADQVAGYVASHIRDFDVARIARVEFSEPTSALVFRARLSEGAAGFLSAMHEVFVSDDATIRCSLVAVRRSDVASEIEAQLFSVAPGQVVGPFPIGPSSHALGCLLQLNLASDGAETRRAAEQVLFERWLAKRRSEAVVTWHWGRTPDTM